MFTSNAQPELIATVEVSVRNDCCRYKNKQVAFVLIAIGILSLIAGHDHKVVSLVSRSLGTLEVREILIFVIS
jgi:hypothetical protein